MADFIVTDEITKQTQSIDGNPLRLGRVGYLNQTKDDLVVTATSDNIDITTGPGNDVIIARGGFNFINPDGGNNILVGGTGQNDYTLTVPLAGTASSHDLITNLHVGDSIHFVNAVQPGFETTFNSVMSIFGPAFEIGFAPLATFTQPLLTVDLPGFSATDFQDDPNTTRLTFTNDTLTVVR